MKKGLYLFFTAMSFFAAARAQNTAIVPATLAGPTTSGSSDQPWGAHRPVTKADRDAISVYRSGQIKPAYSTDFTDSAMLHTQWQLQSDDNHNLKSCRRPQNIVATKNGLKLQTLIAPADCHAQWSTGIMWSKFRQKYGFFEARIRIADISGLNNAFWLVTDDHFEIDIVEVHYPDYAHLGLQLWRTPVPAVHGIGIGARFKDDLSKSFHDYGILWTPASIVYEVDGEPIGAFTTHDSIAGPAIISFATALADFAGKIPDKPQGHDMAVQSLRVFAFRPE
jgi:beta-glucanase (GH16 family)